ncbi:MAG TPA: DUF438 domain-containing protein [Candidatus Hydrogenedentes bacterium]|nr:DUF438 domain-containing protein [Candidatus Hydrogenedentota bacterium]
MKLTGNTRIGKLIERYPFLIEFLGDYAQEFQMLRNAVMRKTVARFATLDKAAGMARIDRDQLLRDVAGAIARETGETVEVDAAAIEDAVDAERVETLKQIVTGLHEGKSLDEVKAQFAALAEEVSPAEIAAMEQRLVQDGIAPEEIKRLCDVHVAVFKDALAGEQQTAVPPGHPVDTFKRENEALGRVIRALRAFFDAAGAPPDPGRLADAHRGLAAGFERLGEVDKHYLRKEHQLFPQLEKHGITAPPKVMWAVHDDIRAVFKQVRAAIEGKDYAALATAGPELLTAVDEMVYKEENILFPMSLQVLSERDWVAVREGEEEIGYALATPAAEWRPALADDTGEGQASVRTGLDVIPLDTGLLNLEQVNLLLTHLPVEISFVDDNDEVRYYSDGKERLFPRSPGAIGRKVQDCHPQKSVHIVNRILDEFRAGTRDVAEFWIPFKGRFVQIRYFAVRNVEGQYRGCLEVTQDVTAIRALEGERRLLDWN